MDQGVIYKMTCLITKKCYIGQTTNYIIRSRTHITDAFNKNRPSYSSKLSRAMRKYGKDNWKNEIICDNIGSCFLNEYEIFYIDFFCSFKYGYNSTVGGQHKGYVKKGKKRSAETCIRISKAKKGKPGRKWTNKQKAHHSSIFSGKKKTAEHIKKIAEAQRGKKRGPHSEKTKDKISRSNKGRKKNAAEIEKFKHCNRIRGPRKGKYKGVSYNKKSIKWVASISYKNKTIYLGAFCLEDKAATVYNAAATRYYGNSCYLNCIKEKKYGNKNENKR